MQSLQKQKTALEKAVFKRKKQISQTFFKGDLNIAS